MITSGQITQLSTDAQALGLSLVQYLEALIYIEGAGTGGGGSAPATEATLQLVASRLEQDGLSAASYLAGILGDTTLIQQRLISGGITAAEYLDLIKSSTSNTEQRLISTGGETAANLISNVWDQTTNTAEYLAVLTFQQMNPKNSSTATELFREATYADACASFETWRAANPTYCVIHMNSMFDSGANLYYIFITRSIV